MKLSYKWIKDYVDVNATPEEMAEGLTMTGSEVDSIEKVNGDSVMEMEITSNRPDCLNMIGLAREVSVVFDKDLRLPGMDIPAKAAAENGPKIECIIENQDLCPRYTARVIADVSIKEKSPIATKHITSIGLRSVNDVVDITNFCLMENGQPLHAFDLDKLSGGKIIVREAKKGEKIITLDGEERELAEGMLIIADAEKPVAVAGIMGGKFAEVTEKTKNILLESAYFDPLSIRRTARALGLSSDSSYRFERGVDKGLIDKASDRAALLIAEETGGKICCFYDAGDQETEHRLVDLDIERTENILGVSLEKDKVKKILTRLGLEITAEEGKVLTVCVPTFREDLNNETDLVEEVARVNGYDKIPVTLRSPVFQIERKEYSRRVIEKLRNELASAGLNEIMTYSLISEKSADMFASITNDRVELVNPLSEEHKILTPQLAGGMLKSIAYNINRRNKDLAFFEIGKIYSRPDNEGMFIENPAVCIGITGNYKKNWQEGEKPFDLFSLKGMAEISLKKVKVNPVFAPDTIPGFSSVASITIPGEENPSGFIAEVSKKILDEFDIEQPVFICQINLEKVLSSAALENSYHSIPKFPTSTRDVSILCGKSIKAGDIKKVIHETGEELLKAVDLTDVYTGKQIEEGRKSLTYSIEYGLDTRTLTDEEIEAMHGRIKDALADTLGVNFR